MARYVPRAGVVKKSDFLKKCEKNLLREIRSPVSDYSTTKLFRAAERVRGAQLGILRAKKHYLFPHDEAFESRADWIDSEIAKWTSQTIEAIIKKYEPEV